MRTMLTHAIALILIASLTAQAQTTQPVRSGDEDPSQAKLYFLRITCEPTLLPRGSHKPIEHLLMTGVVENACARIVDGRECQFYIQGIGGWQDAGDRSPQDGPRWPPVSAPDWSELDVGYGGQQNVIVGLLDLSFQSPIEPEKWPQLVEAIRQGLQDRLVSMHAADLARSHQYLEQAEKRVVEARMRLADLHARRSALLADSSYSDLSREFVTALARDIEKERQDTALRLEQLKLRQNAVEQAIAATAARAKEAANEGHATVQAYKVKLEAVQRKLDLLKQQAQAGLTPMLDVANAEVELAAAKAELQVRIGEVVEAAGGKRLPALNEELATIALDLAEAQARTAALNTRSAEMKKVVALSEQYEMQVGTSLSFAQETYQIAERKLQALRDRMENLQPPTVSIYGR